jgi:ankyrin repeat protein
MSTLESLLLKAIEKNDISAVSSLIEKGVNVNDSPSPLHRAAALGHIEIMTALLDAGADIDAGPKSRNAACYAAIANDRFDALKLLLDRGAKIDASLLKAAVQFAQNEAIFLLLLDAGAPFGNLTSDFVMNLVAAPSSVAVLKRLLARNVNVCALKGVFGRTLCHRVIMRAESHVDVDELIRAVVLDAGVDVNAVDEDFSTPLHFAANRRSTIRVLVELGADIDRQDDRKLTALHLACRSWTWREDGPCVPLLLALGANVHLVDKYGQTACHIAATREHEAQLCACLAAGGDLDLPDIDGNTVRTIASREQFKLPTSAKIDEARRHIAKTRLDLVRERAFQICVALQPLNINALELCEIMSYSFGALGSLIAFHQWWAIAVKVKHFLAIKNAF